MSANNNSFKELLLLHCEYIFNCLVNVDMYCDKKSPIDAIEWLKIIQDKILEMEREYNNQSTDISNQWSYHSSSFELIKHQANLATNHFKNVRPFNGRYIKDCIKTINETLHGLRFTLNY